MGRVLDHLDADTRAWIAKQQVFFVATAPNEGHLNLSPRGIDTFRVLDEQTIAWLDLTGSGVETIAHLRQNGRIVIMMCAFEGPPKILRLHGTGRPVMPQDPEWQELRPQFPELPGERAIIVVRASRISDSCGYGVPLYQFESHRETLIASATSKGPEKIREYQRSKNAVSIDGLPGLPSPS